MQLRYVVRLQFAVFPKMVENYVTVFTPTLKSRWWYSFLIKTSKNPKQKTKPNQIKTEQKLKTTTSTKTKQNKNK